MEILKKGEVDNKRIKFTCHTCGCIFIADEGEYSKDLAHTVVYGKPKYICYCPTCKRQVYKL